MFYDKKTGRSYTTSNVSQEYIPKSHQNPKTPVHAQAFKEDRKRSAMKRKKQSEQEARESKKQWVRNGSGHDNLFNFFSSAPSGKVSATKDPTPSDDFVPPVPVSSEKIEDKVTNSSK